VDLKIEVKLGKLLNICHQVRNMLEISIFKIKGQGIVDVYKVTTAKINDFDEAMLIIQIQIGRVGISDVLLDGQFGVNIIFERL